MVEAIDQSPLARTLLSIEPEEGEPVPKLLQAPPDGYHSLSALANDPDRLGWLLARLPRVWQSDDPRFPAAWLFEKIVAHTIIAFVGSFALHRRVPQADAYETLVSFDHAANCNHSGLINACFACMPDDPDAGRKDARVLNSEQALAENLLERLHQVYLPLARALAKPARRGLRTQLRVVGDLAISAAWVIASAASGESEGIRLARLLGQGQPPLRGRHGFRDFTHRGRTFTHRVRATCCLFYTCGERRYCFTCPLPGQTERQQRWARYFDARIGGE